MCTTYSLAILLALCLTVSAEAGSLTDGLLLEDRLSSLEQVQVTAFRFEGNTVFSSATLAELVSDYTGRSLGIDELHRVPALITKLYVDSGYATSGALLPDQEVRDGIIRIRVVEGRITDIQVTGSRYVRPQRLQQRLATAAPLNLDELRDRINLLQAKPLIRRVNARVMPGAEKGQGVLRVEVDEERPVELSVVADNRRSPTVGSQRVVLAGILYSPMGWEDELSVGHSFNEGPDENYIAYRIPLNASDLALSLELEENDTQVTEAPFNDLDMESKFSRYELGLHYPLVNTLDEELMLSASLEHRRAKTTLLDFPFSFAPGVDDGVTRVTNVHLVQQWTRRRSDSVLALRSDFRFGTRLLNATVHDDLPDGRANVWLGQAQWIRKLGWAGSRIAAKAYIQRTDDTLLPTEKFSIGGMDTVRGYRESALTRDNALVASLEWWFPVGKLRIPHVSVAPGDGRVEAALFYDYGEGSNKFISTPDPDNISSIGLGLSWRPSEQLSGRIFWGHPLRNINDPKERDLQDDGFHFELSLRAL